MSMEQKLLSFLILITSSLSCENLRSSQSSLVSSEQKGSFQGIPLTSASLQKSSSEKDNISCNPDDPECEKSELRLFKETSTSSQDSSMSLQERQQKRCEACMKSYRCSKLKKCENCEKSCKESGEAEDSVVGNFHRENPENLGLYFTIGEFGPGPQMNQIAQMLNIPITEEYEKFVILAKALSRQRKTDCKDLVIDTANVFHKRKPENEKSDNSKKVYPESDLVLGIVNDINGLDSGINNTQNNDVMEILHVSGKDRGTQNEKGETLQQSNLFNSHSKNNGHDIVPIMQESSVVPLVQANKQNSTKFLETFPVSTSQEKILEEVERTTENFTEESLNSKETTPDDKHSSLGQSITTEDSIVQAVKGISKDFLTVESNEGSESKEIGFDKEDVELTNSETHSLKPTNPTPTSGNVTRGFDESVQVSLDEHSSSSSVPLSKNETSPSLIGQTKESDVVNEDQQLKSPKSTEDTRRKQKACKRPQLLKRLKLKLSKAKSSDKTENEGEMLDSASISDISDKTGTNEDQLTEKEYCEDNLSLNKDGGQDEGTIGMDNSQQGQQTADSETSEGMQITEKYLLKEKPSELKKSEATLLTTKEPISGNSENTTIQSEADPNLIKASGNESTEAILESTRQEMEANLPVNTVASEIQKNMYTLTNSMEHQEEPPNISSIVVEPKYLMEIDKSNSSKLSTDESSSSKEDFVQQELKELEDIHQLLKGKSEAVAESRNKQKKLKTMNSDMFNSEEKQTESEEISPFKASEEREETSLESLHTPDHTSYLEEKGNNKLANLEKSNQQGYEKSLKTSNLSAQHLDSKESHMIKLPQKIKQEVRPVRIYNKNEKPLAAQRIVKPNLSSVIKTSKTDSIIKNLEDIPPLVYDKALKLSKSALDMLDVKSNEPPVLQASPSNILTQEMAQNSTRNEFAKNTKSFFYPDQFVKTAPQFEKQEDSNSKRNRGHFGRGDDKQKGKKILGLGRYRQQKPLQSSTYQENPILQARPNTPELNKTGYSHKNFGKVIPSLDDPLNSVLFLGDGLNLPLNIEKSEDGSYKLSVDLEKLCDCKETKCSRLQTPEIEEEARRARSTIYPHTGESPNGFFAFSEILKQLKRISRNQDEVQSPTSLNKNVNQKLNNSLNYTDGNSETTDNQYFNPMNIQLPTNGENEVNKKIHKRSLLSTFLSKIPESKNEKGKLNYSIYKDSKNTQMNSKFSTLFDLCKLDSKVKKLTNNMKQYYIKRKKIDEDYTTKNMQTLLQELETAKQPGLIANMLNTVKRIAFDKKSA